jgi:hypothetical protein
VLGERRNTYRILVGQSELRRPLCIPRHRWEDNIKVELKELVLDFVDLNHLVQDRDTWPAFLNTVA